MIHGGRIKRAALITSLASGQLRSACLAALILATPGRVDGHVETRDPLPVPDLPGLRTLKGAFHLHTVFSDGNVWPTVRVLEAWRDGLDVIALTDHLEYRPHVSARPAGTPSCGRR